MSEQKPKAGASNAKIISFIVILSFICALILSVLSSALQSAQTVARELDRSKEMMIAARILNHDGYFQIQKNGEYVPARMESGGILVEGKPENPPDRDEIIAVYRQRFRPLFVNSKGETLTLEESGIDLQEYIDKYKKTGYYKEPLKLLYEILPNIKDNQKADPIGYVFPVNGYGLWDAIYGYIAIKPDGNTVIGISWYEQKETPGLGANISEAEWQRQFYGKHIFQPSPDGDTNFQTASLGIIVVRGKVEEVLGNTPKSISAVDGMAGATLTGNGVEKAYKDVLNAYRPFLLRLHQQYVKSQN
ncbi:MAG: Na(+)-translocating NADH-quinone reductase subunit C [Chlamydiales bacterium]